ncbi:MAG: Rne/Rng family ribonuclease [Oxalobacteraceae bacterium]
MKRMLFNATQQEELRVAIVDGQKLIDIDIETTGREQRKSNIYKGVITRIEPSLEACFVNYGEERHGFLPFKEVARGYFKDGVDVRNTSIKDALREGQEIMVQVEKEERGNKGAALTTFVSLAGRYLVLMPNNPRGGGVSRRVEGEDRQELRETMDKLDLPSGMSVIARTAGIGRNVDELQWDLNYLMQLWRAIEGAGKSAPGAFLIYQESSLVIRAIRDYFQPDIGEILIDTDGIYEQAHQFMSHVMPDMVHRVKRYSDDVPLFSRFQIEHQIETAYSRTVPLPSGGAIVIDHTEALVSVDVNSARATRGSDIETTAFNTNCEAAEEVARQLRLRDLGGLIVIDFIDMENAKNQREVETRLKDALHYDRARVQMGKISRFGLMELSRQRLRPSLSEGSHVTCPRCNGTGHIRDTESSALQVLRIIQEEAMKEHSAAIHVQAPVDVAAFLLNEKRGEILKIETRHRVTVILIPNKHLETPHYKLERIKHDDPRLEDSQASYTMAEKAETDISYDKRQKEEVKPRQEAMVKGITPSQPAPLVDRTPAAAPLASVSDDSAKKPAKEGLFSKFMDLLFGKKPLATVATPVAANEEKSQPNRERNERSSRNPRSRGGRNSKDRGNREERDAARPDVREDSIKPDTGETSEARPARPPRQPRPPREAGEENENRRGRNSSERQQRSRDESKESNAEGSKIDEALPIASLPLAASVNIAAAPIVPPEAIDDSEPTAEDTALTNTESNEQGDEPRRRRRRGGRNRNRRDREPGDQLESGDIGVAAETNETTEATEATAESTWAAMIQSTPVVSDAAAIIVAPAATQAEAASDITATAFIETTPAIVAQAAIAPAPVEIVATEKPSAQSAKPVEVVTPVEVATPVEIIAPIEEEEATTSATTSAITAIPTEITKMPVPSATVPVVAPSSLSADLQQSLAAAGLTQATTDPEKLRAAQENAAKIAHPVALHRERKPLQPLSTEPLSQIETRN